MRFSKGRKAAALVCVLALACLAADGAAGARRRVLPNPVLMLQKTEPFTSGGKDFTRYVYQVDNFAEYPDSMFAAAPNLPPCGKNANSSRTWVDIYDQGGKRLYGFCALGKASDLNGIWFAMEATTVPPSYVYIELNDRSTNTKYKSNLADTVL
ncbi:MAG TPA: hypothetical protein VF508_00700 [Pyrinomonadaceae bacterium]